MMSTTEDRIESLENQLRIQQSQVRRQRRWNIALGALVVVGGLMAAAGDYNLSASTALDLGGPEASRVLGAAIAAKHGRARWAPSSLRRPT